MKYHVTKEWDGKDLVSAAKRYGEAGAIDMFCKKWDADESFAIDQITKVYVYSTIEDAQEHKDVYGGEILEIDDTYLELVVDEIKGQLCSQYPISATDIKRVS